MSIARIYRLTCDCCGSAAPTAPNRAEAKATGRASGWRVGDGQSKSALCPRCIPIGHDRTGCLAV